jgi:hypothetical protein
MRGSWVYLTVGGQTCIGWIAAEDIFWNDQWVLIEPLWGFCQETWKLLSEVQYVF